MRSAYGLSSTRILIADDQPLILRGLDDLFSEHASFRVAGSVSCWTDLVPMAERIRPDLLITDSRLNGRSTLDAITTLAAAVPEAAVLVFSLHSEISLVCKALLSGAAGYILKTCSCDDLLEAVRTVSSGQRYLSPEIDRQAAEIRLAESGRSQNNDMAGRDSSALTGREQEVLQLVSQGLTSKEIAGRLGIGRRTVESHSGNLLTKLGVRNKAQLVRLAITERMVQV